MDTLKHQSHLNNINISAPAYLRENTVNRSHKNGCLIREAKETLRPKTHFSSISDLLTKKVIRIPTVMQ
jgi:hypothetical protein